MTATDVGPRAAARPKVSRPRVVFLALLLLVIVGYTKMAFDLEWVTAAGRIGPGFFPRIIGGMATVVCLGALLNSFRTGGGDDEVAPEDEVGEGDLGRHPVPLALAVGASALLLLTFLTLGAIVSGALFMLAMLAFLNPGRWVVNIVLASSVPLGLYLLFQTLLNAGLPEGVLPRF